MTVQKPLMFAICTCLAAAGLASACSEDDAKPAVDAGPGDGGGAETSTGQDAGGGDAGASDTSIFAPDAPPPDAGTCTPAQPLFASGFAPSCAACLAPACCAQIKACEAVDDCRSFAQCFAGCLGDGGAQGACTSTCIAGKDGGGIQSVYNQFVLCGGNNCNNDGGPAAPKCPF